MKLPQTVNINIEVCYRLKTEPVWKNSAECRDNGSWLRAEEPVQWPVMILTSGKNRLISSQKTANSSEERALSTRCRPPMKAWTWDSPVKRQHDCMIFTAPQWEQEDTMTSPSGELKAKDSSWEKSSGCSVPSFSTKRRLLAYGRRQELSRQATTAISGEIHILSSTKEKRPVNSSRML